METFTIFVIYYNTMGTVKPTKANRANSEKETYEFDLRVDLLGEAIKNTRKEQNLTQEQLGRLVGVQKSQISKLEKNTKNVTLETIQKVFKALQTSIRFTIEKPLNKNKPNK